MHHVTAATNIIPSSRSAASLRPISRCRRRVWCYQYLTAPSGYPLAEHLNQHAPRAVVKAPGFFIQLTGTGANSSTRCCASAGEPGQDNACRTAPAGSHQSHESWARLHRGHSCSTGKPVSRNHHIACGRGNVIPNFCQLRVYKLLPARSSDYRDLKTMLAYVLKHDDILN